MNVTGLPANTKVTYTGIGTSTVSATIEALPVSGQTGNHNLTYTVVDLVGKVNSVTVPLIISANSPPNATPTLDPIQDITVQVGSQVSFVIGMSDLDNNLVASSNSLIVDGLPSTAGKSWVAIRPDRIALQVVYKPTSTSYRGTYLVNITGKDGYNATVKAQMKIIVK